jgi:hypothetical protein
MTKGSRVRCPTVFIDHTSRRSLTRSLSEFCHHASGSLDLGSNCLGFFVGKLSSDPDGVTAPRNSGVDAALLLDDNSRLEVRKKWIV